MSARPLLVGLLSLAVLWGGAEADTGALIKVARGTAWVQRAGQTYAAKVGVPAREGDVLLTGSDGALGVTFSDNSLVSIGPASKLGIIRYTYDAVTRRGRLETTLYWGTLSATSGRTAQGTDNGMSVATPRSLYRVHGTDVVLRVEGGP